MSGDKSANAMVQVAAHQGANWRVICLCAEWCGVCREYEAGFQALQAKFPGIHFAWLDVEDQENVLGDVDVETFPTLLIGRGAQPLFFGALLPQVKVLERLLTALLDAPPAASTVSPEAVPLWQRITGQ